jgi:hypothetical protein
MEAVKALQIILELGVARIFGGAQVKNGRRRR